MLITRRVATGLLLVPLGGIRFAGAQPAPHTAQVTFVLVNDIYLMSDTLMPDGKRRGGFARLAAVVKAERARAAAAGGNVIFAHAGDTLSPSLMSSLDQGASIVTLTNLVAPDIFTPGNHEYDFGKAVFLERMAAASFPRYGANLRNADGAPLPGFQDRSMRDRRRRAHRTDRRHLRRQRARLRPRRSQIPAVGGDAHQSRRGNCGREGADFVVAVAHVTREQGYELYRSDAIDLILTGHTHDLFINYDGNAAMVESNYDAHYVTAIDVAIDVKDEDGKRSVAWWPQFRVIDTAVVTPDPEMAARGGEIRGRPQRASRHADRHHGGRARQPQRHGAFARDRDRRAGCRRHALVGADRGGDDQRRRHPRRQDLPAGRDADPARRARRAAVRQPADHPRRIRRRAHGRDRERALETAEPDGRFPQVSGISVEADVSRPPGSRVISVKVGDAPLDPAKTYTLATNDFMARGGDDYVMFRDIEPVLPVADSPTLAYEVIDYIVSVGTVRTVVGGRIVVR